MDGVVDPRGVLGIPDEEAVESAMRCRLLDMNHRLKD